MTTHGIAIARAGLGCVIAVFFVTACESRSAEPQASEAQAAHGDIQTMADSHAGHAQMQAVAADHEGHSDMQATTDAHAGHAGMSMAADPHAAHRAAMDSSRYVVSERHYDVPDVELIDQSGMPVALPTLLESDEPIALNFIFTTCTTICPVMTATFVQMRRELGPAAADLRLVSISIDPEYDRPEVLEDYAERFGAAEGWTFLTGDSGDVVQVLNTFGTFSGSKMNHQPITLLKNPARPAWIRIDGLASGKDLAHEVTAKLLD